MRAIVFDIYLRRRNLAWVDGDGSKSPSLDSSFKQRTASLIMPLSNRSPISLC
jgi:hypothetical protein